MMELLDSVRKKRSDFVVNLNSKKEYPLYLTLSSKNKSRIVVDGREYINFISNNYLGLSSHPKVEEAMKNAIDKYGVGMPASPVMSGMTDVYDKLCEKLAQVYQKEAAIIFPSGYQAMVGIIHATISHGDVAILDSFAHRSLIDGAILSGASRFMWQHNDMESLEKILSEVDGKYKRKLIIVDSVYSMDGDIAKVPDIYALKKKYNAFLMVDEAHSLGVIGEHGYGIIDHFKCDSDNVDLIGGVFSKYGGLNGGFAVGTKEYMEYLQYASTGYLFSTAIAPHSCAGALKALELLEEEPEWREKLWDNIKFFTSSLKSIGFDIGKTSSAVIPVFVRESEKTLEFSKMIFEAGVAVSPVFHPGVKMGEERIRMGITALHTKEDLEKTLEIMKNVGKKLAII